MNAWSLKRKLKSTAILTVAGYGVFAFVNIYKGNEKFYKQVVMPLMHCLDPERAHQLAIFIAKHHLMPKLSYEDPAVLKCKFFDKQLSNPIGLAAGFDKHAEAITGLRNVGFSFVEVGSVTPKPQAGNIKPRLFRLTEDKAVINRYGFNSVGHDVVVDRLDCIRNKHHLNYTLGVNLGKNKTSTDPINDYVEGVKKFAPFTDYLVINISSPNTPGLRSLQTKVALEPLLKAVVETRNNLPQATKPYLLLKLAPDLSYDECKDIAEVLKSKSCKMDGLIVCNSTTERPDSLQSEHRVEVGGLSGHPLGDVSTKMISDMHKLTDGMMIIGVGGIFSGKDAYDKIKAGASVVQLYTGMVYEGPTVVTKIKRELAELLAADGYTNVTEAVGINSKN
ncbi:hypothetical protein PPYR_07822 [Photinus pyralis]|uniref:Dihydroorotate dehydrogenase (quinone), mitochondrial n=3 Tax=Photinus pyralis TaxID=7054 RepID=A0A1Y1NH83_PHOPY|nr:dihydroorotate dehydrogenase (quinone), mitochondrial isoform X1 [Photinus pyralis]KAB0799942.1 hypothetical protein PPYR_07822 [Photinus pyralis]